MATAFSPTSSIDESPNSATVNASFGSIFITARSVFSSLPITFATYSEPVLRVTVTVVTKYYSAS